MSAMIPESHRDLLEEPVFVTLATVMPDGQPQCSVVWCSYDGEHVLINTTRGRQKAENMAERPKVTLLAIDPEDPYRYLEVRGKVIEMTEEGALEHIDALAKQYLNAPSYYGHAAPAENQEKETRVICKIEPTRARPFGG